LLFQIAIKRVRVHAVVIFVEWLDMKCGNCPET